MDTKPQRSIERDSLAVPEGVQTPCLLIDPEILEANYHRFVASMPLDMLVRFATKCNPDPIVLRTLARLGCSFEAASVHELELLVGVGVAPSEVVHTFPHRSIRDLQASRDLGVGRWSVDAESELEKLVKYAPDSRVGIRIAVDDSDSRWPLSRKFGVAPSDSVALIDRAIDLGLQVDSVSFHVGSQVQDSNAWSQAITLVGSILDQVDEDVRPSVINLGGGFPVPYVGPVPEIELIGESISAAVDTLGYPVTLEAEPGRYLVAAAGTLITEVTGTATRDGQQWVFLDVGAFNGLYEAAPGGGSLEYPIRAVGRDQEEHTRSSVLGGPTCDGDDTIGSAVMLPDDLLAGDRLLIDMAGAYSSAYTQEFCGVPDVVVQALDGSSSGPPISVGGVDMYRVAWPGSDLFDLAIALEHQWFELSGFVEADGLDGYGPYQAASTFVVVQSPEGDVLSVCRLISPSAQGFKTTNDFELSEDGRGAFDAVLDQKILEVGTMATHPAARGLGPTLDVVRGVIDVATRRKVTHLLTSLDVGLFEVFTGHPLYMPCTPIGEPKHYFGSMTVPGFGPLAEHKRLLADRSPAIHDYLYGSRMARPVL